MIRDAGGVWAEGGGQFLADQLTLFQPGVLQTMYAGMYVHHITAAPPPSFLESVASLS